MTERRGILYAAAAYTCWGLLSPGNEILLRHWTPMWMQVARSAIATALLWAWLGRDGMQGAMDILRRPRPLAALFWGTFLSFAFFILAQTRIPATFATLGFYTSPLWTAMLGRLWLGERMGKAFFPTVIVLLAGGYLALTGGGELPPPDVLGMVLAVGAGAAWGVYAVKLRQARGELEWKPLLLASTLLGTLGFLLFAAMTEPFPDVATFDREAWVWMGIQVAIPTLAALAFFQAALRHAPAGHVNIMVAFELAATILFVHLLLDARFSTLQFIGLAVVMVAVATYIWLRDRTVQDTSTV